MKRNKHSKRYAVMFLNSVGADRAPKALQDLLLLKALVQKSPELRGLLENPVFSRDERKAALEAVGGEIGLSEDAVKFVDYLSEAGAAAALGEVADRAVAMYAERMNLCKAKVRTPVPLGGEYDARLRAALGKLTGREVEIQYVTDPSLIGGILVEVGSTMYDASLKGQLRLLKDELIKG